MADQDRIVVLGIELDISSLAANAANGKKEIADLTKVQKQLIATGQQNTIEFQKNAAQLRDLNTQYKETAKVIDSANKIRTTEKGSISQMRAELQIATAEYNKLSEAERNNSQTGGKLQADIKKLTDGLKSQESAIGDNRRNVGDYASAMKALPGPLGQASKGVGELKEQFLQLLANPIILLIAAIVVALVALKEAFTSTDSGANEFNGRLAQIGAIIDVFKQKVSSLAKGVADIFKGDFTAANKDFSNALDLNIKQFKDAANGAYEYVQAIDDLEDRQAQYVATAAENKNKIARLEFDAADRSKTIDQRKSALLESIAISKEESEQAKKFAEEKLQTEAKNLASSVGLTAQEIINFSKLTEDQKAQSSERLKDVYDKKQKEIQAITKFYADTVDADTSFFEENKKNNGKVTAFEDQQAAERKAKLDKQAAEYKKRQQDIFDGKVQVLKDEASLTQAEILNDLKATEKKFDDENKLLNQQEALQVLEAKGNKADLVLIEAEYQQKRLALVNQTNADIEKSVQDSIAAQRKILDSDFTNAKAQDAINANDARLKLIEELNDDYITRKDYEDQLAELNFEAKQSQLKLDEDKLSEQALLEADGSDARLQLENQVSLKSQEIKLNEENFKQEQIRKTDAAQRAALQAQLQVAQSVFGNIANLFDKGTEAYKTFATAQAIASTASGAIGAFAQGAAAFPPPYGEIVGAVAAAAVVAEGAVQIAKINGLYDGGYTDVGNPREEAHNIRLSSGQQLHKTEYVVPHQVLMTKVGSAMVKDLEAMRVGSNTHSGIAGFYDGGFSASSVSQPVISQVNNNQTLQNIILNQPKRLVVHVESINDSQQSLVNVESRANI